VSPALAAWSRGLALSRRRGPRGRGLDGQRRGGADSRAAGPGPAGPGRCGACLDLAVGGLMLAPAAAPPPVPRSPWHAWLSPLPQCRPPVWECGRCPSSRWRPWRRRSWVVVTGLASVASAVVSEGVYRPWFSQDQKGPYSVAGNVAIGMMIFAAAVATGFYVGARRELFVSMQERALTAEREQALVAQAARDAERTRIAREMHDDLAPPDLAGGAARRSVDVPRGPQPCRDGRRGPDHPDQCPAGADGTAPGARGPAGREPRRRGRAVAADAG